MVFEVNEARGRPWIDREEKHSVGWRPSDMEEIGILKEQEESQRSWSFVILIRIEVGRLGLARLSQENFIGSDKEFAMGREWGVINSGVIWLVLLKKKKEFYGVLWKTDYGKKFERRKTGYSLWE